MSIKKTERQEDMEIKKNETIHEAATRETEKLFVWQDQWEIDQLHLHYAWTQGSQQEIRREWEQFKNLESQIKVYSDQLLLVDQVNQILLLLIQSHQNFMKFMTAYDGFVPFKGIYGPNVVGPNPNTEKGIPRVHPRPKQEPTENHKGMGV